MLVRLRKTRDGAGMEPTFVRERRRTHIRMMRPNRLVARIGHKRRNLGKLAQLIGTHAEKAHLQFQVGNNGEQVGIAHALANAVDGSLHMTRAGTHR